MRNKPNMWANATRPFLVIFALVLMSEISLSQPDPQSISTLYSKGYFEQVAKFAPAQISRLSQSGQIAEASKLAVLSCRTFIQLARYDEANQIVDPFISDPKLRVRFPSSVASLFLCKAAVSRAKRDSGAVLENLRLADSISANDSASLAGYYLEVGRTLYSAGHDFAAIIWLEKAEKAALANGHTSIYYDALRFLSLAWTAKFYYANALSYAEKLVTKSSIGEYEHRSRIAHLELASLLDLTGQPRRSKDLYLKGLALSTRARADYHAGQLLSSLLLRSLYENDIDSAKSYLARLESIDKQKQFSYECLLGRALVENFQGNRTLSDDYFSKLANEKGTSDFIVPYWKSTIAERDQNWKELITNAHHLRKLTEDENFQDDLPRIYYKLALGSWRLGDERSAREHAAKSLSLFEPFRNTPAVDLSIAMMEVHHSVYRLLSEIEVTSNPTKAFEYSERLKANLLRDRIERSVLKPRPDLSESIRNELLTTSRNYIEGKGNEAALTELENGIVTDKQTAGKQTQDFSTQDLKLPEDVTIVSYEFTQAGQLFAFVLESRKTLRTVELPVNEVEAVKLASEIQTKIRDRIFFKIDGKKLYDLLLKPLDLKSNHLVIVPDKLLWRIPFHALSPDGSKYLIETNTVSYSPSVYLLKQQLLSEPPRRQNIQIFANDTFNRQKLAYVNSEAISIGKLFGISPRLNATKSDFLKYAAETDILHFSMHAQLESETPLSSFLAFQQNAANSGNLTVNDLLAVRLKPNNLAFLASCDTSKVHSGEGLISIPWALLGAGTSSVISSQWEASDKSTSVFASAFYAEYLKGHSTAASMQKAAISMIRTKEYASHEPYFWAGFTLLGDFR
ncbi:MAG TPA: CHAT domain-containing protein [Pyrinomonadaceae bacterium]|nr:CHAT domain-containing protein [Pyrinomonadaceae bacterium]